MDQLLIPKQRAIYRKPDPSKVEAAIQLRNKVEEYYNFNLIEKKRSRYCADIRAAFSIYCYQSIGLSYSAIGMIIGRGHDLVIYYNSQRFNKTILRRVDEITLLNQGLTPRNNVDEVISITNSHFSIDVTTYSGIRKHGIVRINLLRFIRKYTIINYEELLTKLNLNTQNKTGIVNNYDDDTDVMKELHKILSEYVTRRNNL